MKARPVDVGEVVDLVRTGEKFALFGESPAAWIQADPSTFVDLEQ
jgi:hypothetical protein